MSEVLDAVLKAAAMLEAQPKPPPMTIIAFPGGLRGKAWQMLDEGRLYAFVHPEDIAAIPAAPAAFLSFKGVPVRPFDDEMRAVFVRGLARLAEGRPR